MEVKLVIDAAAPLCALFKTSKIRIIGSVAKPLFLANDVAYVIRDGHMHDVVNKYSAEAAARRLAYQKYPDKKGRMQNTLFFTEPGLYRYLLQSRREEAEEFQEWVEDHLCALRQQLVNKAELQAKIAGDTIRLLAKKEGIARECVLGLRSTLNAICIAVYDDRQLDSCPIGLAEFHIARYIARRARENLVFTRDEVPQATYDELRRLAVGYFRRGWAEQEEYGDRVALLLDELVPKIARDAAGSAYYGEYLPPVTAPSCLRTRW
jgi:hypothetical protein